MSRLQPIVATLALVAVVAFTVMTGTICLLGVPVFGKEPIR